MGEKKSRPPRHFRQDAVCRLCKSPDLEPGFRTCISCRIEGRKQAKEERAKRVAENRCITCGRPRGEGREQKKVCERCVRLNAERREVIRDARVCPQCGTNPLTKHRQFCSDCNRKNMLAHIAKQQKRLQDEAKAKGLCPRCRRNPSAPGLVICNECRQSIKQRNRDLKRRAFAAYGGRCACCGQDFLDFLCLDHVNNDGAKRRRNGEAMANQMYSQIVRYGVLPKGIQVLCHCCNFAKRIDGEKCRCQDRWIVRGDGEGI